MHFSQWLATPQANFVGHSQPKTIMLYWPLTQANLEADLLCWRNATSECVLEVAQRGIPASLKHCNTTFTDYAEAQHLSYGFMKSRFYMRQWGRTKGSCSSLVLHCSSRSRVQPRQHEEMKLQISRIKRVQESFLARLQAPRGSQSWKTVHAGYPLVDLPDYLSSSASWFYNLHRLYLLTVFDAIHPIYLRHPWKVSEKAFITAHACPGVTLNQSPVLLVIMENLNSPYMSSRITNRYFVVWITHSILRHI